MNVCSNSDEHDLQTAAMIGFRHKPEARLAINEVFRMLLIAVLSIVVRETLFDILRRDTAVIFGRDLEPDGF